MPSSQAPFVNEMNKYMNEGVKKRNKTTTRGEEKQLHIIVALVGGGLGLEEQVCRTQDLKKKKGCGKRTDGPT